MSNTNFGREWSSGDSYEPYVGRWSRLVAKELIAWLGLPEGGSWLDVGCGTGALSQTILLTAAPVRLTGLDRSEPYVRYARLHTKDKEATFAICDAQALPFGSEIFDAAVSGLVLNFIPQPGRMVSEMLRVVQPGDTCALYVWDYAEKMQMMRTFWECAAELDPEASRLDEGARFSICQPEPLRELFTSQGAVSVEVKPIEVPTIFKDFDDYWNPFLGGQAPAPTYARSLTEEGRANLREALRARLPTSDDGSIKLIARAWAVKGQRP